MATGKRKHGESFKKYRARLEDEAFAEKAKLNGRLLWNSGHQGTYVRAKHGELR